MGKLFKEIYIDAVTLILVALVTVITLTILTIALTGDRESGIVYGLYIGFTLTLTLFFYLRTKFNWWTTLIEIIVVCGLSFGEFLLVSYLFSDTSFIEMNYGYIFILTVIPILLSLNKQLADYLADKFSAPQRTGKRFDIM